VALLHRAEKKIRQCKTSFVKAAGSSRHEYQQFSNIVDFNGFDSGKSGEGKHFTAGRELLLHQPELATMQPKLHCYCVDNDIDMRSNLLQVKGGGTLLGCRA